MKIAMFCLEFPPLNTTGNYRNAGFARVLSMSGVDVIVFTLSEQSGLNTFGKRLDLTLMHGLDKVKIFRYDVKPFNKIWRGKIGNAIRIWWNNTDKIDKRWFNGNSEYDILSIIKIEEPDVLFFSLPPFSVARMALRIHKLTGIPMIVDMRDAWSLWGTSPHATYFHYLYKKFTERKLFSKASTVIGVTPELIHDFKFQHPNINPNKFKVIFNGVDNFFSIDLPDCNSTIYKIGYVGSFYYSPSAENKAKLKWYQKRLKDVLNYTPRKETWIYRSPYFFIKTLSQTLLNNPKLRQRVSFEYIGEASTWLLDMINDAGLSDIFVNHGFKDKREVLAIQKSWSAILATSEKIEGGQHFCLPSKIFDAVQSKKRILAFVTAGTQETFLKGYPQTVFFNPDLLEKNSILLGQVIGEGNNFLSFPLDSQFTRETQSLKLIEIISKVKLDSI
jgi:hypothetical protein